MPRACLRPIVGSITHLMRAIRVLSSPRPLGLTRHTGYTHYKGGAPYTADLTASRERVNLVKEDDRGAHFCASVENGGQPLLGLTVPASIECHPCSKGGNCSTYGKRLDAAPPRRPCWHMMASGMQFSGVGEGG